MLHPFISAAESHGASSGRGLAASVALHVALVALAVTATTERHVRHIVALPIGAAERIVFSRVAPARLAVVHAARAATARAASALAATALAGHPRAPIVPNLALEIAIDDGRVALADALAAEIASRVTSGVEFDTHGFAESRGWSGAVPMPDVDGRAYSDGLVERQVYPFATNPRPRYPDALQAEDVEATFTVSFVVDSTGRIDARSVDIPLGVHRLFARSVRDALLRSRYLPAQLGGRAVSQLVRQRFSFIMAHR